MISVESMLVGLSTLVLNGHIKDTWHRSFLSNVSSHVASGNSLSTNQGAIVIKVARNHASELARELRKPKSEVDHAVANPHYERPPYQSISIKREVRYIGMDKLAFRFKMDTTVVSELKALRSSGDPVNTAPMFNKKYRLWVVTVTPTNLEKVFDIIKRHKFEFDEGVLEYMTLCTNSKQALSTFASVEGEPIIVANICRNPLLSYVVKNVMNGEPV